MALNVEQLGTDMIAAIRGVLTGQWPTIRDYATGEAKKLAQSLEQITVLRLTGQATEAECSVLLEMQKNSMRAVLLAIQGMALITVEMAINAALDVVRTTVNGAIGFALL